MSRLLWIGQVVKVHGLKGSFVVKTDTGAESSLEYVPSLWIGDSEETAVSHSILEADWMPKGWKVTLEGTSTLESAELLIGKQVFASREDLDATDEDEFYLADLVGLTAFSESDEPLGKFLRIEPAQGGAGSSTDRWWFEIRGQEIGIPATKNYVKVVDIKNQKIVLKNFEEFLDLK